MDDLEAALSAHGYGVAVEPSDENPAMPYPGEGWSHWRVTLDGGVLPLSFHVSTKWQGEGGDAVPDPATCLALLAADLGHPALGLDADEWLAAVAPEGAAPGPWAEARRHLLDLLDDVRALPRGIQEILLPPSPDAAETPAGPRI